ncbi:hypothetical protein [Paraburkholderia caribensis]|uniref:hypothetical protein n=1 Tax=Paraburkholderia caribensis TaxID=75105 RepID=UPI0034D349A3
MGIIDFREIVSPNTNHALATKASLGTSNLPDDFEVFCKEFFELVKKMTIFSYVSSGPDNGIDLGVEEDLGGGNKKRWLVSCKHKAHSRNPVSEDEEKNIIERVAKWECDGFIPFYTTVPSAKVASLIEGVEKFGKRVERYFKDRIEQELLGTPSGIQLAARYFPKSLVNHYGKVIATAQIYSTDDVILEGDLLIAPGGARQYIAIDKSEAMMAEAKDRLRHIANLYATMSIHAPYFTAAIRDAIRLAPDFFTSATEPQDLKDLATVKPTWAVVPLYRAGLDRANGRGLGFMYFVGAVWSFWNFERANEVFAEAMALRHFLELDAPEELAYECRKSEEFRSLAARVRGRGLLTPGIVALKLQEEMRDILTRLIAFANPIPDACI